MQFSVSKPRMFFGNESWGNVLHGGKVLQTPAAAGGDCSGDGSAAGSRTAVGNASTLCELRRFEETKALMRRIMPVARRVLGESNETTLKMLWIHAEMLYKDDSATLSDLRKAVTMLEDAGRIARRVFGGTHPLTTGIEGELQDARAALRARETPSTRV